MPFVQRVVTPIYISRAKKSTTSAHSAHSRQTTNTCNTANPSNGNSAIIVPPSSSSGTSSPTRNNGGAVLLFAATDCTTDSVAATAATSTVATTALALPASDYEFEAVTNLTLSNALRQLASLVLIANDIFNELHGELQQVGDRARVIKGRVERLGRVVEEFDPKLVTVRKWKLHYYLQCVFYSIYMIQI